MTTFAPHSTHWLPSEASAPVVFFSNGIGDRLLVLPALRALERLYPERLTLLCDTPAEPFFRVQLDQTRVVSVDHAPGQRRRFDASSAIRQVGSCDLFLSTVPWSSEPLEELTHALAPKLSVGFAPFFDVPLPRDYSKHSADLAFDLVLSLDASLVIEAFSAPLRFEPAVCERADRLLEPLPPGIRVLSVHGDTLAEKRWHADRMVEAIKRFSALRPEYMVVLVGMEAPPFAEDDCPPCLANCCGLPLDLSMRLVAVSDLFLGVDSCMLHVADLMRVPGVGLFGPTGSSEFGFRFGPHRHLQGKAMMDITPDEAAKALSRLRHTYDSDGSARRFRSEPTFIR